MSPAPLPTPGAAADLVAALLARCRFAPPGTAITCAVSGGADSTALVVLAVAAGCRPTAVHVDHGLRAGSADEARVVQATAERLGVPWRSTGVVIEPGPNLEARARAARYAALPADVVTGHTADDQAETVVVNLLRGSATGGLAAMRPGPRRPLLALRRHETVHLCETLGLTVVHDESNLDPRFVRNRVRHEVLPLLVDVGRRDPVPILHRQADLLRDDDDLLTALAATIDPTDARALAAAPLPLARRAVRAWLAEHAGDTHPHGLAAVQRVLDVAAGLAEACELPGGARVERHRQRLQIVTETVGSP